MMLQAAGSKSKRAPLDMVLSKRAAAITIVGYRSS